MNTLKLLVFFVYISARLKNLFVDSAQYSYESDNPSRYPRHRASNRNKHLVSIDIKNKYSTKEVDYHYDTDNERHTFTTKHPYLIDTVTKGNHTLWDSAKYGYEYGNQVVFGNDRKTNKSIFRVYFPQDLAGRSHDSYRHDSYKGDKYGRDYYSRDPHRLDSYRHDPYRYDRHRRDSYSDDRYALDHYGRDHYRHDPYGRDDYDYGRYDHDAYYPRYDKHSRANLITLNTSNKFKTNKVDYHFNSRNNTHTFKAVWPNLFRLVKRGEKIIWEPERGYDDYPDTVYMFPGRDGRSTIRVAYPSDRDLERYGGRYGHRFMGRRPGLTLKMKPADLDLNFTWNTHMFDFSRKYYLNTYTAKNGYAFKSIKRIKGFVLFGSEDHIWTADNRHMYASKVENDTFNNIITVYCLNGIALQLTKISDNHWSVKRHYYYDVDEPEKFDYKLFTLDVEDRVTTAVYDFKISKMSSNYAQQCVFTPKEGILFNVVKKGNKILWSTKDYYNCANQVYYYKDLVGFIQVTIFFPDAPPKIFTYDGSLFRKSWSEIDPFPRYIQDPFSTDLDITIQSSTGTYFFWGNKHKTFRSRYQYVFTKVSDSNIVIWKSTLHDYSTKVTLTSDNVLTIYLRDRRLVFRKVRENYWRNESGYNRRINRYL